ncbi:hypothetical protein BDN72DRAFT_768985 [Pluteus cervinus]|uniref:Uncharacterized protein n=1 Tax=Pluteus cervinus TaxID=181527 RepID=A0ACD3ATN7_9AGAR|nr:hypothetical protein BDN72DRAFT_768985 [Pluteus cervinus]
MNSDQGLLATNRSPQPVWSGLDPVHGATDSLSATKDDISGSYTTYRPPLPFHPPIWAQSRQELCESFDWFRSYQGGVYHANNAVKGYLLSAFPASRDCFEHAGKLIISHGGGKAECLHTHKGHVAADDQLAQDKSVRALLTTYYECRPLVLVIDDKYTLFPYDLGTKDITYAILGFYTIVAAWAEYQPAHNERGRVVRYKFAFRWCESQGQPWWGTAHPEGIACPEPAAISAVDQNYLCSACGASSPHIYTQGWACLNTECSAFWKTKNGSGLPDELAYRDEFLRLLASLKVSPILDDLFSPTVPYDKEVNANTGYTFSRGWHCRGCGRLSCRVKMEHWECSSCQAVHSITGRVRCAQEFWQEIPSINFRDFLIWEQSEVQRLPQRLFKSSLDTGHVQSFILPNGWGVIHHIQHSTEAGRRSADDVFEEYQHQANAGELPFRRWPLRSVIRGPMLTNYFSQNCTPSSHANVGSKFKKSYIYQYVGGTANTLPFSKAPSAVLSARKLIQTRIEAALAQSVDFNEVLSAAYMERQRMAGDVLVMEGLQIQEHYEHTVVPTNYRIAATARWIDPERHL